MGRKRKPIEQHKREGTFRPCSHKGPELDTAKPDMPKDLEGVAAKVWNELTPVLEEMGVLTIADGLALRLLCDSYAGYVEACEVLEEKGAYTKQTNKNGSEYISEHPAVKTKSRLWKEVESMARQFGLTPSARNGLSVSKPKGGEMSALAQILKDGRN